MKGPDSCICINEIYIFKADISLKLEFPGRLRNPDCRNCLKKFIDPFLRCSCTLDHAGCKSDCTYGECEHVYIHHKLHYGWQVNRMIPDMINTTNHDGNECADPN